MACCSSDSSQLQSVYDDSSSVRIPGVATADPGMQSSSAALTHVGCMQADPLIHVQTWRSSSLRPPSWPASPVLMVRLRHDAGPHSCCMNPSMSLLVVAAVGACAHAWVASGLGCFSPQLSLLAQLHTCIDHERNGSIAPAVGRATLARSRPPCTLCSFPTPDVLPVPTNTRAVAAQVHL